MDYIKISKDIISKHAGLESSEIDDDSYFEDDLNIGELDFKEIIVEIEEKLDVDLSEEMSEILTFGDLASALNEKLE